MNETRNPSASAKQRLPKQKGCETLVNEKRILKMLRRGDSAALEQIIDQYTPYVFAIVSNILSHALPREDMEEVVSDVFCSLWYSREQVEPGKLKAYLAAIARNAAKSRLRSLKLAEPLEDDLMELALPGPEEGVLALELKAACREAVDSLGQPDSEIFLRRYFLYQKTGDIAQALGLNASTVRSKLARGREKLKEHLEERGYGNGNSDQ